MYFPDSGPHIPRLTRAYPENSIIFGRSNPLVNTASPLFSQPIAYRDRGSILRQLRHLPGCGSWTVQRETSLGRYSFLMADPFSTLIVREGQVYRDEVLLEMDPWSALKTTLMPFPFQPTRQDRRSRGGGSRLSRYELNHTSGGPPHLACGSSGRSPICGSTSMMWWLSSIMCKPPPSAARDS